MTRKKRIIWALILTLPVMLILTGDYSKIICVLSSKLFPSINGICAHAGEIFTPNYIVEFVVNTGLIYLLLTFLVHIKNRMTRILITGGMVFILLCATLIFNAKFCFDSNPYKNGELPYQLGIKESYFGNDFCCPIGSLCM